MAERENQPLYVDFNLDPTSVSKRPEQLAALLERALQQEFPESLDIIEIWHQPNTPVVSLKNLEKLEEHTAKNLARRAQAVFHDFMDSPWY